jgi:hypothetical protein
MRVRKLAVIAAVVVLVVTMAGFYLTSGAVHESATSVVSSPHAGSPAYYGHTLIGTRSGPLSAAAAVSLACPYSLASQCLGSYNWGGYVVYNASYSVSRVVGSWTVPTISGSTSTTCPYAQKTWDSNSVWIGIDGANTPTVEQTGTSSDCFYGQTSYYAWYEFYPAGSVQIPITVSPGDKITAMVLFSGNNATGVPTFKTTLTDLTTSATFTSPKTPVPGALRESAEWTDESPYYLGILGLTHVTPVSFSGASATIGGANEVISHWGTYNVHWFLMVDYNFPYNETISYVKAGPTALLASGSGSTMDRVSDGP